MSYEQQTRKNWIFKKSQYSVISKLEREEKINEAFLIQIGRLTLEELIAIKLELTTKSCGGSIYGLPIWFSLLDITRDACIKFALTTAKTKREAARLLGIDLYNLKQYVRRYNPQIYMDEEVKKEEEPDLRY